MTNVLISHFLLDLRAIHHGHKSNSLDLSMRQRSAIRFARLAFGVETDIQSIESVSSTGAEEDAGWSVELEDDGYLYI